MKFYCVVQQLSQRDILTNQLHIERWFRLLSTLLQTVYNFWLKVMVASSRNSSTENIIRGVINVKELSMVTGTHKLSQLLVLKDTINKTKKLRGDQTTTFVFARGKFEHAFYVVWKNISWLLRFRISKAMQFVFDHGKLYQSLNIIIWRVQDAPHSSCREVFPEFQA